MKVHLVLVLAASLAGVPDRPPKKSAQRSDLRRLQGTWLVIAMERRGRMMTPEYVQRISGQLLIKGTTYTLSLRNRRGISYHLVLDPKKNPATIDLQSTGDSATLLAHGIYKLEGNTLKMCLTPRRVTERPTSFSTENTRNILYIFQRVQAEK